MSALAESERERLETMKPISDLLDSIAACGRWWLTALSLSCALIGHGQTGVSPVASPATVPSESAVVTTAPSSDASETSPTAVPRFFLVPDSPSAFWKLAKLGMARAARETGARAEMMIPVGGSIAEQKQIIRLAVSQQISGMTILPISPTELTEPLSEAAAKMPVVIVGTDAPIQECLCRIGTDNYEAGKACGGAMLEVVPQGGLVLVLAGVREGDAIQRRLKGFKDAVAGKLRVDEIQIDFSDRARAKRTIETNLSTRPAAAGIAGLTTQAGPSIVQAVKAAGSKSHLKIVCFDEEIETLAALSAGTIYATIVQKPYEMGYRSIKMLDAAAKGDLSGIPSDKFVRLDATVLKADGIDAFIRVLTSTYKSGE
jgi:ribose transport system substrate-binding protein